MEKGDIKVLFKLSFLFPSIIILSLSHKFMGAPPSLLAVIRRSAIKGRAKCQRVKALVIITFDDYGLDLDGGGARGDRISEY